jgi:dolichyl-phosphate-mannose-protein mannosyltransferase
MSTRKDYVAPHDLLEAHDSSARRSPLAGALAWERLDSYLMLAAMLCALLLYLVRLDQPGKYIYDEVYHAYTAARLAEGNPDPYMYNTQVPPEDKERFRASYEWSHPALAKLPMQAGILLFGDTPLGWRIASVIFGAFGIGIFYALGRTFFDRETGLIAVGLLLFDGLWFVQSRTAMNDIFLVCFLLLAYLAFRRYLAERERRRWRSLWLTGAALGLAIATKWSALYSIGLLGLVGLGREIQLEVLASRESLSRRTGRLLQSGVVLAGALLALPAVLYVAGYVQFFWMGYQWAEWTALQWQMWWYHSNLTACHDWASPWWTWPIMLRPVWYHVTRFDDGTVANTFALGNPLIWWLFLPAIGFAAWRWHRGGYRDASLGLILLGFLGQWLPWAISPRISYLYHMLPSVPFGVLAIASGAAYLRSRRVDAHGSIVRGRTVVAVYLALVALVFVFFYAHYSALPSSQLYSAAHYWLPSWQSGSEWPLRCPQPTFLSRLLSML